MLRVSARTVLSKVQCMKSSRWARQVTLVVTSMVARMLKSSKLCVPQVKQCSWQQQRCFAEAAVAPKFDWDSLEGSVASEEGKRELASLRSTWIDVQQKFDSMSQVHSLCSVIIFAAAPCFTLSCHHTQPLAVPCSHLMRLTGSHMRRRSILKF